jgi:Prenyltransferase and squalene oxidase repeat
MAGTRNLQGTNMSIAKAIEKGIQFLVRGRSLDGVWRDFRLEPGESDSWVTAYVGLCILRVFSEEDVASAQWPILNHSREWLRNAMRADGGWGYNERCPVDSDTTAHAVLFLSKCGDTVPDVCFSRLLRFQGADGGFATFDPRERTDSWGVSHPDVSPTVLRALLARLSPSDASIQRGIDYVLSQLQPNGTWNSFWWETPLYSTVANVQLLEQIQTIYDRTRVLGAVRSLAVFEDPFRAALLGDLLATIDPGNPLAPEVIDALVNSQQPDGSWHALSPTLRVTLSHSFTPWASTAYVGDVVSDPRHFYTTATVLRCLVNHKG